MSNLAKNSKSILLLTTTGLVSAVVTVLLSPGTAIIPLLPKIIADELGMGFAGSVYGIAIALYFVSFERIRSVWRVLLFIIVSTCAYSGAVFSAFALFQVWPSKTGANMSSPKLDIPLPIPFVAGLLGAFLVLFAALYLFYQRVSQIRVLKLAFSGSFLGGLSGVLGWGLGTLLPGNDEISIVCSSLTWQPAVSFTLGVLLAAVRPPVHVPQTPNLLGIAWPRAVDSFSPSSAPQPSQTPRSAGFPIIAVVFFLVIASFVAWRASEVLHAQRFAREYQKCVATMPSMNDLPVVHPITPEQALILHPIGVVSPKQPYDQSAIGSLGPVPSPSPPGVSVLYAKPEETELRRDSLMMFATVQQYPNEAWANYYASRPCAVQARLNRISKLGYSLTVDNSTYDSVSRRRIFIWNSVDYLITIRFDNPGPAEDSVEDTFLKPYLEKYPSTM